MALLGFGAAIYLAAAGYMTIFQRSFLYKPAPGWLEPSAHGIARGTRLDITAVDGAKLAGWWIPPDDPEAPVFLYFHGNANGLDRRAGRFHLLTADGAGLLAMSYRGYGGSDSKPTESLLHADASTIHAALLHKGIAPSRIVIFGESLGSGVALNLARKVQAKAVILDSPYLSVLDRGQAEYPWLPVSWLLTDTFRSDLWIAEVKTPIFIFHGDADRVIPVSDSARLAAKAVYGNVTRKIYPGEGHVVPLNRGPLHDLLAFLAAVGTRP